MSQQAATTVRQVLDLMNALPDEERASAWWLLIAHGAAEFEKRTRKHDEPPPRPLVKTPEDDAQGA
jgi:hypothetical protein